MAAIDVRTLSLKDALDLAIAAEEEAQERYDEFARITGGRYAGDASEMFKQMSGYEARHRADLTARRRQLFGNAPVRFTAEDLDDDIEAPDRGAPRTFMSARQAMEVALASEEKARDFYRDAAAHVDDRDVRALFEGLAQEEEAHMKLVGERLEKLPVGPDMEEDEADAPGSDAG